MGISGPIGHETAKGLDTEGRQMVAGTSVLQSIPDTFETKVLEYGFGRTEMKLPRHWTYRLIFL
jgi:hypothetical protein